MSAVSLPLKFQLGARTLFAIPRRLVRVPLSLEAALGGGPPALPPLAAEAHGYSITSLPAAWVPGVAKHGLIAFERQAYTRYFVDLRQGEAAFLAGLSANTRSGIKRKAKKLGGAGMMIRAYRTPDELAAFHALAAPLAARTYQARLLGSALPADPAFVATMLRQAAADQVRAWLLLIEDRPAAYLYCPADGATLRYDYVGHDPDFAELSPGSVLLFEALKGLLAEGRFGRFDFTEGEGQHKRQFASGGVDCRDLLLLRPTLANRAALTALAAFDGAAARGKALVGRLGLERVARRLRR